MLARSENIRQNEPWRNRHPAPDPRVRGSGRPLFNRGAGKGAGGGRTGRCGIGAASCATW